VRPEPTIADLVRRARRGEAEAARALYEAHVDSVYGACLAFSRGDATLAADLCQESFATALAHLPELAEPAAFPGWLKTICRRTCLRQAERWRAERATLSRLATEPRPSHRDADRVERIVAEVIAACPEPGQRQAAARFYGDPPSTTEQIAQELGISRTAVTTRLHRFRTWARATMLGRLAEAMDAAPEEGPP